MLNVLLAVEERELGPIRGIGPLGFEGQKDLSGAPGLLETLISNILGALTVAAIIWFVFQFLIGAFSWIGSSGDPKAIEAARNRIYNAFIGLVVIFGILALASILGTILNIPILNIAASICNLAPEGTPGCS